MQIVDFSKIQETSEGGSRPPVGGYVLCIVNCEENTQKQYFQMEWDYAEGQFENHNQDMYTKNGWRYPKLFRSYKNDAAMGMLKHFLSCLEKSNQGFNMTAWNKLPEPQQAGHLNGLIFGAVIGEEEYQAQDGSVKVRQVIRAILPVSKIREGDFKIPPLKKLQNDTTSAPAPVAPEPANNADLNQCPF
nr:MAG TPA_asm: hypothetical protein [Caudoviricetes sp.]